jgi:uncharacterized membrane protein
MENPTNQGGEWQHVPSSDSSAESAPASNVYASQGSGYPPPNDPGYPPPPPQGGGYPPPPPQGGPPQGDGLSPTAAAAISYITIIPAIIFLVIDPYKRIALVRFHSFQCLFFHLAIFVLNILAGIVLVVLSHIPVLGCVVMLIWPLISLLYLVLLILCIIKASRGEYFKLPIIGDLALKTSQQA